MKDLTQLKSQFVFSCVQTVGYDGFYYHNRKNYKIYSVSFDDKIIGYVKGLGGGRWTSPKSWESWKTKNISDVNRKYVRGSKKLLGEYSNRIDAATALLAKTGRLKEVKLKKNSLHKNAVIVGLENPQIMDDKVNPMDPDSNRPKITAKLSLVENGRLRQTNAIINPKVKNKVYTVAQQQEIKVDNLEEYIGLIFSAQEA